MSLPLSHLPSTAIFLFLRSSAYVLAHGKDTYFLNKSLFYGVGLVFVGRIFDGTIKNATIKAEDYGSIDDVKKDLNKFLIYYNFNRRDGSLRKELKVRTPFEAVQSWF